MAMMPGLQINQSPQLKLTPQLQQSIKILQYSAIELQEMIADALDNNIMLEAEEPDFDRLAEASPAEATTTSEESWDQEAHERLASLEFQEFSGEGSATSNDMTSTLDCQWDDIFDSDHISHHESNTADFSVASFREDDDYETADSYTAGHESLYDHLRFQVETFSFDEEEQLIAFYLIDAINDNGYFEQPLADIAFAIAQNEGIRISERAILNVLMSIQQNFEPSGVGARNVQECLLIQLSAMIPRPRLAKTVIELLTEHFEWFSHGDFARLKRVYGLSETDWQGVMSLIQSCNPKPGLKYVNAESDIIIPDLVIKRAKKGWKVELNPLAYPRVRVNSEYVDLLKTLDRQQKASDNVLQLKENLNEAKGLIKSIQSRGETLLKVGAYLVKEQAEFFEQGEIAMKPLVLRDVADALGMHESTISRATTQKYMQTPRGTYELKYFFSSSVSQYGPQDQSATAIKARIKQLIDVEDPKKPISDQDLAEKLSEQNISVARRTVAKYREAMNIPSSSQRRKK
jgi:RNA polymerase sigma-54 factor